MILYLQQQQRFSELLSYKSLCDIVSLLTFVGKSMCLKVNLYTGTDDATSENSTYMAADPASINTKLLRGQLQHTPPCLTLPLSPTSPFSLYACISTPRVRSQTLWAEKKAESE